MDSTPNGTEPRMNQTPNGLNPQGTQPRMDSTPNGLNSEWTERGLLDRSTARYFYKRLETSQHKHRGNLIENLFYK
jgi:hypothetical protein